MSKNKAIAVLLCVLLLLAGVTYVDLFGVNAEGDGSASDVNLGLDLAGGVSITYHDDNSISIELHIIVENGVNLPAVCRSIMNEVRYVVTKNTGVPVKAVDVCVDSMTL